MSCQSLCCSEDAEAILKQLYLSQKLSYQSIGALLEVSHSHIRDRIHQLGIQPRKRIDYENKGGRHRISPLWKLSDQELFETPTEDLMEKFGVSFYAIHGHKSRRRKLNGPERKATQEPVSPATDKV